MKICFDCTISNNHTGIGQVAKRYLTELEKTEKNQIVKYGKEKSNNFDFIFSSYYNIFSHIKFYFYLKQSKPDVIIIPHYFIPFFIPKQIRIYTIVHDLMAITKPAFFFNIFSARIKATILLLLLKYNLKSKKDIKIITPSYSVANDVNALFNRSALVIPNGQFETSKLKQIDKRNFFLYIGNNRKHKNLPNLFKFFNSHDQFHLKVISGLNKESNFKNVEILGKKDSKIEVLELIKSSQGVIMPSFCEGFGLPIIESLLYSGKAIASDIDVFKEFYGLDVDYFDPFDFKQLELTLNFHFQYIPSSKLNISDFFTWQELIYFIKHEFA